MFALIVLVLLIVAGIAAATGHVADTRDPGFGLGPLLRPHPKEVRR
ncbi:hypothetical protein [uncultured Jatrophihabitans sp.]